VKCHITSLLVQDSYFGGHHCDTVIIKVCGTQMAHMLWDSRN